MIGTLGRVLGRLLHAAAGSALLGGLLIGTPWFLLTYADNPLPDHIPSAAELGDWLVHGYTAQFFWDALTVGIWVFWAHFATLLCIELGRTVHDAVRYRERRQIARTGLHAVAAVIVTALVGAVLFDLVRGLTARTATTAAVPPPPLAAVAATTYHGTGPVAQPTGSHAAAAPARTVRTNVGLAPAARPGVGNEPAWVTEARAQGHGVHRVCAGDNLWTVAETKLGTGNRWREIYVATRDRTQPDGHRLTDPDEINVGWYLVLPDTPDQAHTSAAAGDPDGTDSGPSPDGAGPDTDPQPSSPSPTPPDISPSDDGPEDDGVNGPDLPATPAPTVTPPGAGSPVQTAAPSGAAPDRPSRHTTGPLGVRLIDGGWVDLALAAAVLAAVALVWARRRRHVAATLTADHPGAQPMPLVVSHLRRGLRRPHTAVSGAEREELAAYRGFFDRLNYVDTEPEADADDPDAGRQPIEGRDGTTGDDPDGAGAPPDGEADGARLVEVHEIPEPVVPAPGGRWEAAWPPAGLGLTGDGSEPAARGILVSALAAGGVDDYHGRAHVVIPSGTLATLLGAAAVAVPPTPRMTVTAGLAEAMTFIEEQTLYRTRTVFEHDADSVPAVRESDPYAETMPPLVLIADPHTPAERSRIAAALTQAQRLDIHGVLLGDWPAGDTVTVSTDGFTSPVGDTAVRHAHPADIGRLTVLSASDTEDLLRVLAESHTGDTPRPEDVASGRPPHNSAPTSPRSDDEAPATVGSAQDNGTETGHADLAGSGESIEGSTAIAAPGQTEHSDSVAEVAVLQPAGEEGIRHPEHHRLQPTQAAQTQRRRPRLPYLPEPAVRTQPRQPRPGPVADAGRHRRG